MQTRMTGLTLGALIAALTLLGCSSGGGSDTNAPPDAQPTGNTVSATPAETFTPGTLTVNAGETVSFAFGSLAHNVFFTVQAGAPADIPGNNSNVSIDRAFATAGTFTYTCHIHPSMHGTVVVQ
jgi:plastocyanin